MPGRALGVATSQSVGETIGIIYLAATVTEPIFIATVACIVTSAVVRIRVGSTSGTVTLVKTPSGTTAANGTAFTAAQDISTVPTADTTINIPLIPGSNFQNVTLAPGDAVSALFAGTMTSAVGLLQLFIEPVA